MALSIPELLDKYDPIIRDAFLEAMKNIVDNAQIGRITRELAANNLDAAISAIGIDSAAYEVLEQAIQAAYTESGMSTVANLPVLRDGDGNRLIIRFRLRNTPAEEDLRAFSTQLVTRLTDEQRAVARDYLSAGLERGDNPRTTARDLIGRRNRVTKEREGGVISLSLPQENAVRRARDELETGDYSSYLKRARRDKRFDRTITKAQRTGEALTPTQISKILNRYSDRLLQLRGETIGRTETLASIHKAQHQGLLQMVRDGNLLPSQIRRIWDATLDARTRRDHVIANNQEVGLEEDFNVGGSRMLYPGDFRGGADQVINCRCHLRVKIDFLAGVT